MNRRIALERAGITGEDYWAFMALPLAERIAVEKRLAAERRAARKTRGLRPEPDEPVEASSEQNEEAYGYLF